MASIVLLARVRVARRAVGPVEVRERPREAVGGGEFVLEALKLV
jgi:hypothetical protein